MSVLALLAGFITSSLPVNTTATEASTNLSVGVFYGVGSVKLASSFQKDINALAAAGITTGCATGKFCPKDNITREQMAVFLVRAFDYPTVSKDYFTDDETSSFESSINALAASGITYGCATGNFCPKDTVKRDQMAAFLVRALNITPTPPV